MESGLGDLAVDPFGSCMFGGVRPPWIGPVQACPAEALSGWDLGEFGGHVDTSGCLSRSSGQF